MESMITLLGVLSIIWSVFCIILYVKVWQMTGHVKQIRDIVFANLCGIDALRGIRVGDDVVAKADGKVYKVVGIKSSTDGPLLECGSGNYLSGSQVLSMEEVAQIKDNVKVGSRIKFFDGYYSREGVVKSIDEGGLCTIEQQSDHEKSEKKVPITKLTLIPNGKK